MFTYIQTNQTTHKLTRSETCHIKNDNTAMTEKADKGNSLVILYKPHCHETVNDFIKSNDCAILNKDTNNSCQKSI